jgi:hypothetical protein
MELTQSQIRLLLNALISYEADVTYEGELPLSQIDQNNLDELITKLNNHLDVKVGA